MIGGEGYNHYNKNSSNSSHVDTVREQSTNHANKKIRFD